MIGKVTRGSNTGGLLRYLYGPGKANEHTNPHLVASWRGDDRATLDHLEPVHIRGRHNVAHLAERLNLPLQLLPETPAKHVWQCSMRLADGDRHLTDAEWAQVAREVVEQTGFARTNDPGGCRWTAVRHADDHIHIVVVLARQDGQPVNTYRDWPKVHAAARAVEQRFGLTTVSSPDRSTTVAPSRAETEKAARRGRREPPRAWLTREVRVAAAGSSSREQFEELLGRQEDLVVSWRYSQRNPGQITGYRVGRRGDADKTGQQIWFSGSELSPDLSLPKLQARWRETGGSRLATTGLTEHERHAVLNRTENALHRVGQEPITPGATISAAEVATVLAHGVEGEDGGPLTRAAEELARAARQPGGARVPMTHHVHDLRTIATEFALLGRLAPNEAGQALLIVANLTRIAATLAERAHARDPRRIAARRAKSYYANYGGPVTAVQVAQIRAALPEDIAAEVLDDPALPALAAQMRRLQAGGVDPSRALTGALNSREIRTADSIARVIHHRLATGQSTLKGRPAPTKSASRSSGPQPSRRGSN